MFLKWVVFSKSIDQYFKGVKSSQPFYFGGACHVLETLHFLPPKVVVRLTRNRPAPYHSTRPEGSPDSASGGSRRLTARKST